MYAGPLPSHLQASERFRAWYAVWQGLHIRWVNSLPCASSVAQNSGGIPDSNGAIYASNAMTASGGPASGNVQVDPAEAAQNRDPIFAAVYKVRSAIWVTLCSRYSWCIMATLA